MNDQTPPVSFFYAPEPAWADHIDWTKLTPGAPSEGVIYLLSETQVLVEGDNIHCFVRSASKAASPAGVARIAPVSITFDPLLEKIELHRVAVWRDGQMIDRTRVEDFELLRREKGLERRVYDGRLTADMILTDVRPGDIVELCYSCIQRHPVVKGMIDLRPDLGWSVACGMTRYRLVCEQGRNLIIIEYNDPPKPEVLEVDGRISRTWTTRDTPGISFESYTPPGTSQVPSLHIADVRTWADIADLYRLGYEAEQAIPEDLLTALQTIKASSPTDTLSQVMEVLRLVQRDVRYLAFSMGVGGLVPRSLPDIWSNRLGDCKDKSLLLSRCLNHLEIDAAPALVNTYLEQRVRDLVPCAYAFDHCIVEVRIHDETYYLDPTLHEQSGSIGSLEPLAYGVALPLRRGATLVNLPALPVQNLVQSFEEWEFGPMPSSPAKVTIRTIWRGLRATSGRMALLENGEEQTADQYAQWYDRQYGGATRFAPTKFMEDVQQNKLEIVEHYMITAPYTMTASNHAQWVLKPEEPLPDFPFGRTTGRRFPLALGIPRQKSRVVRIRHPEIQNWTASLFKESNETFAFSSNWNTEDGTTLRVACEFTCVGGDLPADRVDTFFDALETCDSHGGILLSLETKGDMFKLSNSQSFWNNVQNGSNILIWALRAFAVLYVLSLLMNYAP